MMSNNNSANITVVMSEFLQSMHLLLVGIMWLTLFLMLLHISNIIVIVYNRLLHKPVYCMLIHLSLCDLFTSISWILVFTFDSATIGLRSFCFASYTASILTTVAITVDRYVAVVYCLRYREIITKRVIIASILLIWSISLLFVSIPLMCTTNSEIRTLIHRCIHIPLYLFSSIILIYSGFWIRHIRNSHLAVIKKRNMYFGVEGERLNVLQNLRMAVLDMIKLNLITATLIIISNIFMVFYLVPSYDDIGHVSILIGGIYLCSNPIVYILSMTELKQKYKKLFKSLSRKRKVNHLEI